MRVFRGCVLMGLCAAVFSSHGMAEDGRTHRHDFGRTVNSSPRHSAYHRGWNEPHHPRHHYVHSRYYFEPYYVSNPAMYLPSDAPYDYSGATYFYGHDADAAGMMYRRGMIVVPPPAGAVISALPGPARQVTVRGNVYYVSDDVYYKPVAGGFTVVDKPS